MNFQSHIVKIESVLRLWCMRNLTIEREVLSLVISEIQDKHPDKLLRKFQILAMSRA